jgi:hypothetical protein
MDTKQSISPCIYINSLCDYDFGEGADLAQIDQPSIRQARTLKSNLSRASCEAATKLVHQLMDSSALSSNPPRPALSPVVWKKFVCQCLDVRHNASRSMGLSMR